MFTSVFTLGLGAETGLVSRGPHAESKGIGMDKTYITRYLIKPTRTVTLDTKESDNKMTSPSKILMSQNNGALCVVRHEFQGSYSKSR